MVKRERERREVTVRERERRQGADSEMDARWGDGVMIRSEIPLSLPPVQTHTLAHTHGKIRRRTRRRGRPAVVNGPAVRVHLGGGGRARVDYWSLRLEESTPALRFSSTEKGREISEL